MRASTVLNRVLGLDGVRVVDVHADDDPGSLVVVQVVLRSGSWLRCPVCSYRTKRVADRRPVDSSWRHLDLSGRRCELRMRRRRLACPDHGVITEAVPFARYKSWFTTVFEDLVVWLTLRADKTTVARFARVTWRTVGAMCERVSADLVDDSRLQGLVEIGVDEISWRKRHKYLTLVTNHADATVVWGTTGKNAAALDRFFDALPAGGLDQIEAVSMDLGPAYSKAVRDRAPAAVICYDRFHVVQVATSAFDKIRRRHWQDARRLPDQGLARLLKGARWALLKNPKNLTYKQAVTLATLRGHGGELIRAHQMKESLRAACAADLDPDDALNLLSRWCSWAARCRIPEFVTAGRTIRKHLDGITAAITRNMSNARHEALNAKVRVMLNRARGFHTADAALALIMLGCGPRQPQLPYHTT